MRFVNAFIIILVAASLFFVPFTGMIYDFRTDNRDDEFSIITALAVTTGNMTLLKDLYDADTTEITLTSSDTDDIPVYSSYNTTSRLLAITGLAANTTRTITVNYPYDALEDAPSFGTFLNIMPFIWYALIVCLMGGGVISLFI